MTDIHLDKAEKLFGTGIKLAEGVVSRVREIKASYEEEFVYKGCMFFFFCKSYKTYQAVQLLFRAGFCEDAFVLTRSVFEISLQTQYMYKDPKPRARLFLEHDPVARYRVYEQLAKGGDTIFAPVIEMRPEQLAELKCQHDRLSKNYPKGKGWWGNSIGWLANHLGKDMARRYSTVYWMQSNMIHTGAVSIKEYLSEHEEGLKVNCYPAPTYDVMVPQEATVFLLITTQLVGEALSLGISQDIDTAVRTLRESVSTKLESN